MYAAHLGVIIVYSLNIYQISGIVQSMYHNPNLLHYELSQSLIRTNKQTSKQEECWYLEGMDNFKSLYIKIKNKVGLGVNQSTFLKLTRYPWLFWISFLLLIFWMCKVGRHLRLHYYSSYPLKIIIIRYLHCRKRIFPSISKSFKQNQMNWEKIKYV